MRSALYPSATTQLYLILILTEQLRSELQDCEAIPNLNTYGATTEWIVKTQLRDKNSK